MCVSEANNFKNLSLLTESIHDLVICRLSRQSGYARGGDEVFLLCEKINKGMEYYSY